MPVNMTQTHIKI